MNTPIYADLDQIIFENRSREYGAYHMRKHYNRVLMRASIIAFLLFIGITALPKMLTWVLPAAPEEAVVDDTMTAVPVDLEPITDKTPEKKVEEIVFEEPAAPKVDIKTVAFTEPKPTPDDELKDATTIADLDKLDSAALGTRDIDGKTGTPPPFTPGTDDFPIVFEEPKVQEVRIPGPTEFILLEKEPDPVNLDELKHIIGYPAMAREAEIEGKVIVRVLVDSKGDYVKHIVLKDPHPILTSAVTTKINQLKTTPGIQAGRPISVWVTLPFDFKLLH